jgi:hypothetical protein
VPFTFDPSVGRYRDAQTGRLIREEPIRRALDQVIDVQATQMRALSQSLIDGQINLATWQSMMMQGVKSVHVVGATLAKGGWAQMDQSDWGWTGQRVRSQYAYLRDFAAQIASGKQPLNGTALARAELYAHAGRATHRAAQERLAKERGLEQERNQLGAADHCPGCLGETARGWVPIGSLIPCGSRNCLARCRCSIIWRTVPVAA